MGLHIALLILGVTILQQGISLEVHAPRVAIIGGGIGGASASHFLTKLLKESVEIDLYEAKTIGGRLATIKIDKDEVEAGGSIIHSMNMYMQRFVKLLGLEKSPSSDETFGIWNGDEFVFIASNWSIVSLIKLFYRYGFQLYTLKSFVSNMIEDFVKIYDLQDAGQSFANVTALLSAMNKDFPKLLKTSMKEYLLHKGCTEKMINELVQVATVVNYGQEVDIQSFVGSIAVAGMDGDLWSIKDGNKGVPEHLIYRNKKVNVVPSRVTKIRNLTNNHDVSQYEVTYINKGSTDPMTSNYDIVIIAAPLTSDQEFQIEFIGFPGNLMFPGKYQTTYATFIKANLKPKYFGLQEPLDGILSCNPNKTTISSVGKVNSVDGSIRKDPQVWKVFSRKPLETSLVHDMFSKIIEKKEIAWKAYPRYSTKMNFDNFKLHDALYHVNAFEWAGSSMEMSAIAGRNVAILAYNDFLQKFPNSILDKETSEHTSKKLNYSEDL
ncbi:PREDICTED: prenylcysteine oxidase-like [Trachymyrmex cornetzi]|uniref:Prenylcysteine oxidase-like protein n=1 Tax=Trachymyrmex cornetzi TaxID=471704 RepID=A0A195DCW3_9HYME|nr:PREDICTED: prenylcysteine oxidase-like [Trachymyrmex cornetzi]KYN10721.1 Prenylcysteine oxidase-like protein [Trachymyrmex cornetzi]